MKSKFAELILWKADKDSEEVLKRNGIVKNSDLQEPCDRFENLSKTVGNDEDVADGFEQLFESVEKDRALELYAAMPTVKYINSIILNLNDIILKNSDVAEIVEKLVEELVAKTVEEGKESDRDVAEGFEKLYETVEKDEEVDYLDLSVEAIEFDLDEVVDYLDLSVEAIEFDLDDGAKASEKEHFVSEEVADKLDKKNIREDIDSESEMNRPKRNEECEAAADPYVTLVVNDLTVTARKDIDSKTTLTLYCQQNRLPFPEYVVSKYLSLFRARFVLNGKHVVGSGSTMKKAEQAAARKYLHNNFVSEEIPLQAEIPIVKKKRKVPPSKKRKELKRLQKHLAEKDAAREAAEREECERETESDSDRSDNNEGVGRLTGEQSLQLSLPSESKEIPVVYFDLERSTGSEASEIIQLAYCAQSGCGLFNIYPKGDIDPICARRSHKIFKKGNDLVRMGNILPSMPLERACKKFLTFLRQLAAQKGSKPVIVCHGEDTITLFNNMALVSLDEDLSEAILGAINFQQVISDDEEYPHDTSNISLTKIDPQKPNLSETLLGKDFDREELGAAHDALYDSKLLRRVVEKYCGSSRNMQRMVKEYMCAAEKSRKDAILHLSKHKSWKKRRDQSKFYTFFGWEDRFM